MSNDLSKKSVLSSLEPRREPYWNRVGGVNGLFIGYRKLDGGGGTWIARRYTEERKQQYRSLGSLPNYDQAVKAALAWTNDLDLGVENFDATVSDACRSYVTRQALHKSKSSADDAEGRFKRLVYDKPIGRVLLSKLKTTTLRAWLHDQVLNIDDESYDDEQVRRSKDSANRNLNSLKAALNLALSDRLVATDAGWKTVVPFRDVGARRNHFLTSAERHALLEACAEDLRDLVTALLLTPARPGEIAKVTVRDFDRKNGALTLCGKNKSREVTLSTQAVSFFSEKAKGKIGNALLLTRADGSAWNKDAWKNAFNKAVSVAKLPSDYVLYSLRHTAISELIAGGMDVFLIAKLAGTSTLMIDKHYGHLRHEKTRSKLDVIQAI